MLTPDTAEPVAGVMPRRHTFGVVYGSNCRNAVRTHQLITGSLEALLPLCRAIDDGHVAVILTHRPSCHREHLP